MKGSKIKLTVGLPLWRSRDIAWLALEGLCRQKEADFEWELLIIEENYKEEETTLGGMMQSSPYALGKGEIMKYADRLSAAGCARIEYVGVPKPKNYFRSNRKGGMHLSNKWTNMAKSSSCSSLCFLLQAGDDYSQPYRLRETYDLFLKENCDWLQSPKGIFYNLETKEALLYDVSRTTSTGLDMAVRTELLRKVPDLNISRTVDSKLRKNIASVKAQSGLRMSINASKHWKEGLWTHGSHNISHGRWNAAEKALGEKDAYWHKYEDDALKNIPSKIKELLENIDLSGSRAWDIKKEKSSSADPVGTKKVEDK
jgi:hypothetical protein